MNFFHPEISLPRIYLANVPPYVQRDILTRLFDTALFVITKDLQ